MAIQKGATATSNEASNVASVITPAFVTTLGRLIVGTVHWEDSGTTDITSVTDIAGNIYTIGPAVATDGSNTFSRMFYCLNATVGSAANQITANFNNTAAVFQNISVTEFYDDLGAVTWVFDDVSNNGGATGTSYTSPPVTVSAIPAVVISIVGTYTTETFTHTGWTLIAKHRGGAEWVYQVRGSTGSVSPGISWDSSSHWNGRTIAFRQLPSKSAAVTGTLDNATEADVVTGGKTIVVTLTGDTFIT